MTTVRLKDFSKPLPKKVKKKEQPKPKAKQKEPKVEEKQEPEDRSFLDVVKRELKRQQKKVITELAGFVKLQGQKLASGRKTFIDNSVLQSRSKRDMLDQLIKWIDSL